MIAYIFVHVFAYFFLSFSIGRCMCLFPHLFCVCVHFTLPSFLLFISFPLKCVCFRVFLFFFALPEFNHQFRRNFLLAYGATASISTCECVYIYACLLSFFLHVALFVRTSYCFDNFSVSLSLFPFFAIH